MSFDQTLDRREAILTRLLTIGQNEISGIASAHRNYRPLPTGLLGVPRPAFILYDCGTKLTQDVKTHKSQKMPPTMWVMTPQIVILLGQRDTVDNIMLDGVEAPIGPEISQWVMLLNGIITNDDEIIDLVTPNGMHFLSAVETDLKIGRTVGAYGAWLMMLYEFYYPMFPSR